MNSNLELLISKALTLAQRAPSSDNSQPWDPVVSYSPDGTVILLSLALKLEAVFPQTSDYLNRFAIMSLGAFALNFGQGVGHGAYSLKEVIEDAAGFKFYFHKTEEKRSEFSTEDILKRSTDRSLWKIKPLTQRHEQQLAVLFQDSDTTLVIKPSRQHFLFLYHLFAVDLVRFLNAIPRKHFFSSLRFGKETMSQEGLDPQTFGLGWLEQRFLKLLRDHPRLQTPLCLLSAIPFSLIGCWLRYFYSSSIVILTRTRDTRLDWIHLGMALEKIWLYCGREKIGLQPMASTFLVYQYAQIPESKKIFSNLERWILNQAMLYFSSMRLLNAQTPHICARIGYPSEFVQTHLSLRRPVMSVIKQDHVTVTHNRKY